MTENPIFLAKENQSVEEHTNKLLSLLDDFVKQFNSKVDEKNLELVRLACEYHDLGKINSSFQNYIYKYYKRTVPDEFKNLSAYASMSSRDIPHGILSMAFIDVKHLNEIGFSSEQLKVLVTAVCNHHLRSLDCKESKEVLEYIVENDLKENSKLFFGDENKYCKMSPTYKFNLLNKDKINSVITIDFWINYAIVKGLLNKLDYCASAGEKYVEIDTCDCKEMTMKAMEVKGFSRNKCQDYLLDKSDKNVVMTASTGMGKTEAAMLWAGKDKTFYTLPYKVSINAIFNRIKDDGYYDRDSVALLHSDAFKVLLDLEQSENNNNLEIKKKYDHIKCLSYPFTVCTIDQLLLFVFRANGTELMAATLSYSKLIIDEIQAYEPKVLAKLLYGLCLLNKLGGKFLIMTATLQPFVIDYLRNENIEFELSQPFLTEMPRHHLTIGGENFNCEYIINRAKKEKVLVLCNTVKKAQDVYRDLSNKGVSVDLLHSRFIQRDRLSKENTITDFTKKGNNKTGIWISTQLVEASLDIDFDVLFTEMTVADSLLQRLGRCYRSREYTLDEPNVFIYNTSTANVVYDKEIYERSLKFLDGYINKIFREEEKKEYIDKVYNTEEIIKTDYYKSIEKEIEDINKLPNLYVSKADATKYFRDIDNTQVVPIKFIDDVKKIADSDFSNAEKRHLISEYSLNVNMFSKKFSIDSRVTEFYRICNNDYDSVLGLKPLTVEGAFV